MRLTLLSISFIFVFGANSLAQNLDAYKYIIVPSNYDFLRSEDQYQLNSLTKFLFEKKGFKTLMDNEKKPKDLRANPCLAAKADVVEISSMLSIKLRIQLSNCYDQVILSTEEGRSKIKDLKRGYHDALRKAFRSIQEQDYRFDQNKSFEGKQLESKPEPEPVVEVAEESEGSTTTETLQEEPVATSTEEEVIEKPPSIPAQEGVKEATNEMVSEKPLEADKTLILYAQEIENGYQLVDSTPKIVFVALKSDQENSYYLKNKAGILIKQDNSWVAHYYKDGVLVKEVLNIKF